MSPSPANVRAWTRVFRDLAIVVIGVFMLLHETLSSTPNTYIIGAGLVALGIPPALRLDARRNGNGNSNDNGKNGNGDD